MSQIDIKEYYSRTIHYAREVIKTNLENLQQRHNIELSDLIIEPYSLSIVEHDYIEEYPVIHVTARLETKTLGVIGHYAIDYDLNGSFKDEVLTFLT